MGFQVTTTRLRATQFLLRFIVILLMTFSLPVRAGNYFQGVAPATLPWQGGIVPYLFDTNYVITPAETNAILSGLREWEFAANVQFVPYTNQSNYVLLQYTNDGSGTGYCLRGTPSTIMVHGLARGLICHEGGHLFGLQHEHQRIDRNNYIVVNFANVAQGSNGEGAVAFQIDSNSTAFSSYDLLSVMHYAPDDFTNGLGDALDPLPPYEEYYYKIGNIALSSGDRGAVSNLYGRTTIPLTNIVTNTADGGTGSLRAAIYYANDHPGTTIQFNIPTNAAGYSNGAYTISLLGELPPLVSAGITVDGTTQPGFSNHPIVVVDGSQVPAAAGTVSGLHFYGTNGTVRALAFTDFSYAGVQLFCSQATSNTVENCYLGLKPNGSNAAPNFYAGAYFEHGAHNNYIGGANASQRNIISGNSEYGIILNDTNSDGNVILGNYIGLGASGTFAVANGYSGIGIWSGPVATVIGGTTAGAGNVLSGNGQYGIFISDPTVSNITVQGNFIGTDFSGSNSIPNGNGVTNSYAGIGIFSGASSNLIGGTSAGARNIISGNTNAGMYIEGAGVMNNVVEGNYIGLNVSGTGALASQQNGVFLLDGAASNIIRSNVIAGNQQYGIYISDPGTTNNFVLGNYIGTDFTGENAISNGGFGIGVWNSASGNFIGGAGAGQGNVISGNAGFSYGIAMGTVFSNLLQGNFIGTDAAGKKALANGFAGAAIWGGSAGNIIGGTTAAARNVISGNGTYGIYISDAGTMNNLVEGNYIGTDLTGSNALANGFADVVLQSGATSNSIGGAGAGQGNVIAFAGGPGIVMYNTNTIDDSIRGNSIFSNSSLGINFNNAGVAPNHTGYEAGPNDMQNYPVITNAASSSSTVISGTLNAAASTTYFIDVYRNPSPDPSGYGQGQFYVGSTALTTDATGNGKFTLTVSPDYVGQYFSSTATSSGGDTSEFGADVRATNGPTPSQFTGTLTLTGAGFNADLAVTSGQSYSIQATTNLSNPASWVTLTNFTATNTTYVLDDKAATNFRVRFYRAVSP